MCRTGLILISLLLAAAVATGAQPEVVAAEPMPGPGEEATAPDEGTGSVVEKIDIDLIDLELLRGAVEGQIGAERIRLSLQDCVCAALEANEDIEVASYEPLKGAADILTAKGEFDPLASTTAVYMRATQEASPEYKTFGQIDAFEVYRTTTQTSVRGKLRWGTLYDATLGVDKEETTFNSYIEEWNTGLTLTLTQPLLRGRGKAVNVARIRLAKNARLMTDLQLKLVAMNTAAEAVKAYWDLVGAIEAVRVREESLANAERLLEISQKRLEIGTGAALEVLQAKAGMATRQGDLLSARSRVADAEDVLKRLLNIRDAEMFSSKKVVPIDRPKVTEFTVEDLQSMEQELDESIELALQHRPEIQSGELEIANAEIDRKRAANDMLPDVQLTGTLYQGARDHYVSRAFTGLRERTDNAYTVGLQASVPIGNRAARGAFQRARLTQRQAEKKFEKTKQELMLKTRLAMRATRTSQILVESNRQARTLQEANVAAEEQRLRLGVSTSFRVLQVQEDLTLAQTQEVQTRIGYEKALVELRLAEGTLLGGLGVEFESPEPERPVTYLRSIHPPMPK